MTATEKYFVETAAAALDGRTADPPTDGVDPRALYRLAVSQGSACLLCPALRNVPGIPREISDAFENRYMQNLAQQTNRDFEVSKLFDFCRENGIKLVALKGWFLRNYYPDPLMRLSSDADLYAERSDIKTAGKFLVGEGFKEAHESDQHVSFSKPPYVNIELHFSMTGDTADAENFTFSSPFGCSHPSEYGENVLELDATDGYIYLVTHIIKHLTLGGVGLRSVADMAIYEKKFGDALDRERIKAELSRAGMATAEEKLSKLSRVWFHGEESDAFTETLGEFLLSGGTYGSASHAAEIHYMNSGGKSKLATLVSRVFPPPRVMRRLYKYLAGAGIILLPFAWIQKLVTALFRKSSRTNFKAITDLDRGSAEKTAGILRGLGLS